MPLTAAGRTPRRDRHWTTTTIVAALRTFVAREQRWPRTEDFRTAQGLPALRTIHGHFRHWQDALRAAQAELAKERTP